MGVMDGPVGEADGSDLDPRRLPQSAWAMRGFEREVIVCELQPHRNHLHYGSCKPSLGGLGVIWFERSPPIKTIGFEVESILPLISPAANTKNPIHLIPRIRRGQIHGSVELRSKGGSRYPVPGSVDIGDSITQHEQWPKRGLQLPVPNVTWVVHSSGHRPPEQGSVADSRVTESSLAPKLALDETKYASPARIRVHTRWTNTLNLGQYAPREPQLTYGSRFATASWINHIHLVQRTPNSVDCATKSGGFCTKPNG